MVHKAGLQVPHWGRWQEIQCLDCQIQPHGMLQKTSWPSCVNSASQISVLSAAAECEDNATRLSPAVSSLLVIPLCYTSSSSEILLCQNQCPCCGAGIGTCCTFETVAVS